ncbi:MAG: HU family DNA-binding protein [Planctomycetales bacterium]
MTKKEIVKAISEEIGLTQLKTKEIVQKTFDAIVETLVADRRIELRNFGVFEVKKRAARKARNPRTGERVDVAEKYVVTFKPGKEMEDKVRQLEEREAARKAAEAQTKAPEAEVSPRPHEPTTQGAAIEPAVPRGSSSAGRPSYVSETSD